MLGANNTSDLLNPMARLLFTYTQGQLLNHFNIRSNSPLFLVGNPHNSKEFHVLSNSDAVIEQIAKQTHKAFFIDINGIDLEPIKSYCKTKAIAFPELQVSKPHQKQQTYNSKPRLY